jgi:hypothetical protein
MQHRNSEPAGSPVGALTRIADPDIQKFGAITITAQTTVDGGYSISTMTGPIREHDLCFGFTDPASFNRVHRMIATGGLLGVRPAGILAAVRDVSAGQVTA